MGKKRTKRNNRRVAGQKNNQKNSPLIVDQVGNGDGIPTSAPGLAAVVNDMNETKVITEKTEEVSRNSSKKTEGEALEKQIQPSPQQPEEFEKESAVQTTSQEKEPPLPVLRTAPQAKEEPSGLRKTANLPQEPEEPSSMREKPSTALRVAKQSEEHQLSKEPPTHALEHEKKPATSKEPCITLQADKDQPPSKEPSMLLPERNEQEIAKKTIVTSSEENEPIVSTKSPSTFLKEKESAASTDPKTSEQLRQLFDRKARSIRGRTISGLKFETTINEASLGSLLNIPVPHKARSIPEKTDSGLKFETTMNEASLGSLLEIPVAQPRKSHIRFLEQDGEDNKTKLRHTAKSSSSRVSHNGRPRHASHERESKLINAKAELRVGKAETTAAKGNIPTKSVQGHAFFSNDKLQKSVISTKIMPGKSVNRAQSSKTAQTSRESKKVAGSHTSKVQEEQGGRNATIRSHPPVKNSVKKSSRGTREVVERKGKVLKGRAHSGAYVRLSKPKRDATSSRTHRDSERKTASAGLSSSRTKTRKDKGEARGDVSVRKSLFPFCLARSPGRGMDEIAKLQLKNELSNTIYQVMATVENKIAKECLGENKEPRRKSSLPSRK